MPSQLEKAINLAKKTGDNLIVFDSPTSENGIVIMGVDRYEELLIKTGFAGLTENELLDRINRKIAAWKNVNKEPEAEDVATEAADFFSSKFTPKSESESKPKIASESKPKNLWEIPEEVKEGAEEIIEEDRQYLEEVPF